MRVLVLGKATEQSESGELGSVEDFAAMNEFNEKLVEAGVVLASDGLQPTSKGKRITFDADGSHTLIDGPFAETKELIAGFWLLQVKSLEEAIEWIKRSPNPFPGDDSEIEIRRVFDAEDFGPEITPEIKAQEGRLRAQAEKRK